MCQRLRLRYDGHVLLLLALLRHLVGELETRLCHGQRSETAPRHRLTRGHHAHIDVLLLGRLNLLLLLLKQLDLLLDRQLFHSRVGKHAHQRRKLGRASSMGNVQSAPSGTGNTSLRGRMRRLLRLLPLGRLLLVLLIHCGLSDAA